MIKTTAIIAGAALMGLDAPIPQVKSPITSADIHVSYLSIEAGTDGVETQITDTSEFCFNVQLRSGHTVKVSF